MVTEVIKRDGTVAQFREPNIRRAVLRANRDVELAEQASDADIDGIVQYIKSIKDSRVHIELIQSLVEDKLMEQGHYELARQYIIYRYRHAVNRAVSDAEKNIMNLFRDENDDLKHENSNKNNYLNSTQRDLMAGEMSKDLTNKFLIPEDIRKADEDCVIHWHDKDYTAQKMINCCLIDIKSCLDDGTVMNDYLIESPHSFRVACNVMTQIIANIASNQFGGQSVDIKHLGKYVAISREKIRFKNQTKWDKQGIKYTEEQLNNVVEETLKEEIADGVQTIQYQINTLMTTNGQSPFVTIFMYLDEESDYIDEIALIIEEIIRQRIKGVKNKDGKYITPAFPKLIYVLDENNNLSGGRFDYITKECIKCNIKRMYPDYISAKKMRENYEGNIYSCMGCRSFLSPWKKTEAYVKLMGEPESEIGKYKFEGRFNQGVISLNLPQIAIEAGRDNLDEFWQLFDQRLSICYKALLLRHKLLEGTLTDSSPLHWQFGAISRLPQGTPIDPLLHDGYSTLSLGYIGVYETVQMLIGESHTTEKGQELALKIMKKLKNAVVQWKADTGLGFALYGTPAESLCNTFAKHDREKYGEIENVTDHGFYTNSYHVFVNEDINAFDKFKFEAQFQDISTGGCISYAEMPYMMKNPEALEALVKYIYDNILYAEFNTKSDYCYECGYEGEIQLNNDNHWECPCCGNSDMKKLLITRRTCGYLGVNDWTDGKRKEMGLRKMHL